MCWHVNVKVNMLGISLGDTIGNTEIRCKTKVSDIVEEVAKMKLRCVGHVPDMMTTDERVQF